MLQHLLLDFYKLGSVCAWFWTDAAIGAVQCMITCRIGIDGSSQAKTLPGVGLRGR